MNKTNHPSANGPTLALTAKQTILYGVLNRYLSRNQTQITLQPNGDLSFKEEIYWNTTDNTPYCHISTRLDKIYWSDHQGNTTVTKPGQKQLIRVSKQKTEIKSRQPVRDASLAILSIDLSRGITHPGPESEMLTISATDRTFTHTLEYQPSKTEQERRQLSVTTADQPALTLRHTRSTLVTTANQPTEELSFDHSISAWIGSGDPAELHMKEQINSSDSRVTTNATPHRIQIKYDSPEQPRAGNWKQSHDVVEVNLGPNGLSARVDNIIRIRAGEWTAQTEDLVTETTRTALIEGNQVTYAKVVRQQQADQLASDTFPPTVPYVRRTVQKGEFTLGPWRAILNLTNPNDPRIELTSKKYGTAHTITVNLGDSLSLRLTSNYSHFNQSLIFGNDKCIWTNTIQKHQIIDKGVFQLKPPPPPTQPRRRQA